MNNATLSRARLVACALVAVSAALSSCQCGDAGLSLALPKKLRIAEISPARQQLLRASIEIPGLLAPTDLAFSSDHKTVSGSFVLAVDKTTTANVVVRVFGRFTGGDVDATDEVLLGIAKKSLTIDPRASVYLALAEGDWTVSGGALFDLNQNGKDNIDDLVAGIDPAPPAKVLAVLPDALQFPSGVRPGEFTRQVIVVENVSGLEQQVTPAVVGGQGVSITLVDATGAPEGGAPRALAPFTLQPFQEVLLAVTFAPTNEFLVRGSVALGTLQPASNVTSNSEVSVIANSDGDPEPAAADYDPGTLTAASVGVSSLVIFPAASLFGGQPVAPGTVQLSNDPGDVVTIPPLAEGAAPVDAAGLVPGDLGFLVQIPAKSRLSVVLDGLSVDAQLGLFLLDDSGALSSVDGEQLVSANAGLAPEAVQFRNASATDARRALIVIGRVDVREPGDNTVDGGVPFSLLAQLNSGPEFADDSPLSRTHGDFRGGNDLVLSGVDFADGVSVLLGGHVADRSNTHVDAGGATIHTITPPGSSDDLGGALTVVAINPNGEAATLPSVWTYDAPAPEVDDVSPPTASTLGGTSLLITGAFFSAKNGGPRVTVGSTPATDVVVLSSNALTATAPTGSAGFTTLTVSNLNDDGSATASADFPFFYVSPQGDAPTISGLDPATGSTDGGTLVTISGAQFVDGAALRFGGSVPSEVSITSTSITCLTPPQSQPGPVDVVVT
ncbi:MAG TPA: IPT/TIG domain-containing protein, partial [Myxococcota bacterium]